MKLTLDLDGHMTMSVEVASPVDAKAQYDELKERDISVEVKPWRERRSLNANAYLWELCGKLAEKLMITKDEVYRCCIRDCGVYDTVTVSDEAVDALKKAWDINGTGWFLETVDSFAGFSTVVMYCGSSIYDTAQMARLIDGVIEDCKEQGIDTITPDERDRMMSLWESQYCKRNASA